MRLLRSAVSALVGMLAFGLAYVHARIAFAWFRWRLTRPR